jgi:hypothetical protein
MARAAAVIRGRSGSRTIRTGSGTPNPRSPDFELAFDGSGWHPGGLYVR